LMRVLIVLRGELDLARWIVVMLLTKPGAGGAPVWLTSRRVAALAVAAGYRERGRVEAPGWQAAHAVSPVPVVVRKW
jgi:hypothetical protein